MSTPANDVEDLAEKLLDNDFFFGLDIRDIVTATTAAIMCGVIGGDDSVGAVRGMP